MNNAGGHMAILAGAGLAAAFLSAYMLAGRQAGTAAPEAVVVTLPPRAAPAPQPATRPKPGPSQVGLSRAGSGPMSDPAALARTLQRELKRVGCYDGEIGGVWNGASRAAMKAFTERVNAALPVDSPDPVLLALVQAHQGRACGGACPTGEALSADGRCLPVAILGKAQGKPAPTQPEGEPKVEPSKAAPVPIPVPVPVPVTRKPLPAPPGEPPRVAAAPPQATPAPQPAAPRTELPDAPRPQSTRPSPRLRQLGPVPAVSIYGRRVRRFVRRAPSKPAAVARSLLRSLARAAQPPW
jgi:hypothetical protein